MGAERALMMIAAKRDSLWPCWIVSASLILWAWTPDASAPGLLRQSRLAMGDDGLNRVDVQRVEQGYYETLLSAGRSLDRVSAESEPGKAARGADEAQHPFKHGWLAEPRDDVLEYQLRPSASGRYWVNALWSTNAFGMRDRHYERKKPDKTIRLALIGDSIGAGWGVSDDLSFESILERDLDQRSRTADGSRVEFLNFAVPGYAPGQRWEWFTRLGWDFEPDLAVYQATPAEIGWDERRLRVLLPRGLGWEAACYRDSLRRLGAEPGGDPESYKGRLKSKRREILEGVYRRIVEDCRSRGMECLYVLTPRVGKAASPLERDDLLNLAREAGFSAVIDLSDAFAGIPPDDLMAGPNDYHPNAAGHQLLADQLRPHLEARPELTAKRQGVRP